MSLAAVQAGQAGGSDAVVHHALYHEWGLLAVLVGVIGSLIWYLTRQPPSITGTTLQVRELLSSAFQVLVVEEAKRLFAEVDQRLPYRFSQVDEAEPAETRFDVLLRSLGAIEDEADGPSREALHGLITAALADVVVNQVGHLLDEALALARSPIGEKESRSGVRIAFAGETQRRLVLVAMATNLTDQYESRYYTTRRLAKLTTISALVVGVLSGLPVFLDTSLVMRLFPYVGGLFVILLITSCVSGYLAGTASDWLGEHADRYETGEDWMRNLAERQKTAW